MKNMIRYNDKLYEIQSDYNNERLVVNEYLKMNNNEMIDVPARIIHIPFNDLLQKII